MQVGDLIRSDLYRYQGRTGVVPFLKSWLMNRGFNYMFWVRLANARLPILSRCAGIWLRGKQNRYGIQILKCTEVDPGLYIGHCGPCIIHPSARIGSNMTIGAGSVVTRSIPDNCTAVGNPARVINQNKLGCQKTLAADKWNIGNHPWPSF